VVDIAIHGLRGRTLVPSNHGISLWDVQPSEEDEYRQRVSLPLGELRAGYLDHAASGTIDLFELFDVTIPDSVIRSWQQKLLTRDF
jgi:hypothetical protein